MPYANPEDKKEFQRNWHRTRRPIKLCKKCKEIIPVHKASFCSDHCCDTYHRDIAKLKRQKERESLPPRFCKHEKCKKLLPKTAHVTKKYCMGTDCAYKQNNINMKIRRDANRKEKKPKEPKLIKCKRENCTKMVDISKNALKRYCNTKCREANNSQIQRQNNDIVKKEVVRDMVANNKDKKRYNGTVDPKWLRRGNISSNQISTSIEGNA